MLISLDFLFVFEFIEALEFWKW